MIPSAYADGTDWLRLGVDPDIDVDDDSQSEMAGRDPQLERGIAELMADDQGDLN